MDGLPQLVDAGRFALYDGNSMEAGCQKDTQLTPQRKWSMMGAYRRAELDELDEHWGEDYDLAVTSAGWVAKRLDNGRALVAANPGKLQTLIAADSEASPAKGDGGEAARIA